MHAAKATYVVIGDKEGIRYTHPLADRIGKSMVGDDNDRALKKVNLIFQLQMVQWDNQFEAKHLFLIQMARL